MCSPAAQHPRCGAAHELLMCVHLQAAAAQQGVSWDDIVAAAEASQTAQIQPAAAQQGELWPFCQSMWV